MFASSTQSAVSCLPLACDNCLVKRPLGNYLRNEDSEHLKQQTFDWITFEYYYYRKKSVLYTQFCIMDVEANNGCVKTSKLQQWAAIKAHLTRVWRILRYRNKTHNILLLSAELYSNLTSCIFPKSTLHYDLFFTHLFLILNKYP